MHTYIRGCTRMRARKVKGKVWSEDESGEWDWRETHAPCACEAHVLSKKISIMPALRTLQNRFEKSTTVCSPRGLLTNYSHLSEILSQARFIGIEQWNAGRFMNCSESPTYRVFPGDEYQIHLGSGGRLNPTPTPSVHFKTKMAARNGRCSVSTILREIREP